LALPQQRIVGEGGEYFRFQIWHLVGLVQESFTTTSMVAAITNADLDQALQITIETPIQLKAPFVKSPYQN
jgi:hypothetical protein